MRHFQSYPSLNPYAGPWDYAAVRHLLKRTVFGATRNDLAQFMSQGFDASINQLLDTTISLPAPPVKEYNSSSAANPDTAIAAGQTWVNDVNNDGTIASFRRASFKKWWVGTMINQDRNIREKMTLFWHNHFSTESNDVGNAQFVYKHHNLLRTNALGNIKTLTKAVTLDPAMLVYLNGQNNNKTAPDENYARELQELFVIGKGPGAGFTEPDVMAAAKVLTGWRNNANTISSFFDSTRHDTTNKQFSSFYNNQVITGRTGTTAGDLELNDLLDMLFSNQEAALFLCRKLYIWFVYYEITPEVEAEIIVPLAQLLRANNYEVKPVLKALISSEHFFDVMNRGCQIKSPVDMLIGMIREFEVAFPPAIQFQNNYGHWNLLVGYLNNMQQNIGDPPDVSGWKAYYQDPAFYEYWINTDTLPKRIQYLDNLVLNGFTFGGFKMIVDGPAYVRKFSAPGDPNKLIDDIVQHILGVPISTSHKAQLKKDILLAGQTEDYYWTTAWDTFIQTPSNMANATFVNNAIKNLIRYLVDLPEYQLS